MVRLGTEHYGEMGHVGRATDAAACRRSVARERAASCVHGFGACRDRLIRDPEAFDPDLDEAWALVRTVADDVARDTPASDEIAWDEVATEGFGVRPGAVEHAMVALTGDERSELLRLLQAETKQPGT